VLFFYLEKTTPGETYNNYQFKEENFKEEECFIK